MIDQIKFIEALKEIKSLLGAGANIRLGRMMLTVDYAFVDYDILKYTNQIAIGLKF